MSRSDAGASGVTGRLDQAGTRVVVLVRDGCHLCAEAESVIRTVCTELGVSWRSVDVDADPLLRARYTDHVPVTFVDGEQFALWFLDADALRAALSR